MKSIDLSIGERFSHWTILEDAGVDLNGKRRYRCRCDCGTEKDVLGAYLREGRSKRCQECAKKGRHYGGKRPKVERSLILRIVARYMGGESSSALAKEFGVNQVTVLNYVRRSGGKVRDIAEHGVRCRKAPGESARNQLYKQYKATAKHRGFSFSLTKDQFFEMTQRTCSYCGSAPANEKKTTSGSYVYNGLDRVDTQKDYSLDNVVPCCYTCNRAKSDMTAQEFEEWLEKLTEFRTRSKG